jgi:biotin---protein ligase
MQSYEPEPQMNVLIYKDEGSGSIDALRVALEQEQVASIRFVDRSDLIKRAWQNDADLLIFPGGRDLPYHEALRGAPNRKIREFIERSGKYLGICAGGYYGSSFVEFEKGGPLEILGERELSFFPGVARGPAYGLGKFDYEGESGAMMVDLQLTSPYFSMSSTPAYYNGGCVFVDAEKYENVEVLARYKHLTGNPAALIRCKVGRGLAILSGVHPELSVESGLFGQILRAISASD